MAVFFKATGEKLPITPENGKKFNLREAQSVVDGYIELIRLTEAMVMIIDEEGKLKGKPINELATNIARTYHRLLPTDSIVGDVIICKNDMI